MVTRIRLGDFEVYSFVENRMRLDGWTHGAGGEIGAWVTRGALLSAAVLLCTGSEHSRDLPVEGRDLEVDRHREAVSA